MGSYTLRKSIDNTFVKEEIDTSILFTGDDHTLLLNERIKGSTQESGYLEYDCEGETYEKDCYIKHNEGDFDLKKCQTAKKVYFGNPLDCMIEQEINIFDYAASDTNTVQGTLERLLHVADGNANFGDELNTYTLEQVLSILDGIPDYSVSGWVPEYIEVEAIPQFEEVSGQPQYQNYTGHSLQLRVYYIRLFSNTQINADWFLQPVFGGYFFNPTLLPAYTWNAPSFIPWNAITEGGTINYVQTNWTAGRFQNYRDLPISNTFSLNEILESIFTCTGLQLVSNFFGINPDATETNNKYYQFAESYCKDIKISQSYDIIREASIEDSFGQSGKLKVKDVLTDLSLFFNMVIVPDIENEIVRWEHISYFQTKGFDLSTRDDVDFKPLESDKEEIDSELFLMAQPTREDYYQIKIRYQTPDLYREENERKYQVKKFLTDVFETLNNEKYNEQNYKPLFFLLSTDGDSIISLNEQFSINRIFRELHDLNRPYKNGQVGDNVLTFDGFSIGLKGEIKIKSSVRTWENLYPFMAIKTIFGTYKVEEVECNENGIITIKTVK